MKSQLVTLLNLKYGEEVTKRLFQDNKLQTQNISPKNANDQNIVKDHLRSLFNELNLNIDVNEQVNWAFDFPGWTGELNFGNKNVKKYMVIGLEPHIESFDFQITYGLSDYTPLSNEPRFSIDKNKKDFIQCKNDSSVIWTNLFNLFTDEGTYEAVVNSLDKGAMKTFLDNFYITDLCHFAPQGQANAINGIPNWPKVRSIVASAFLEKEIACINPELIVTQGSDVFSAVVATVGIRDIQNEEVLVGTQKWNIRIATGTQYKVLSLPHIGSQMINRTFWRKNIQQVKSILKTIEVIS